MQLRVYNFTVNETNSSKTVVHVKIQNEKLLFFPCLRLDLVVKRRFRFFFLNFFY